MTDDEADAIEVRLVEIEQALIAATNTIRAHRRSLDELFARVDRLIEQLELGTFR